jgi:hypothetical protein
MKKQTALAAMLCLLIPAFSNAQFQIGPKAAINSGIFGDAPKGSESPDSKMGFHIGAAMQVPINEQFAFAPELLFAWKSAREDYSETFITVDDFGDVYTETDAYDITETYTFLDIPLMFKYITPSGFNIHAGPQIGFLLNARAKGDFSVTYVYPDELPFSLTAEFDESSTEGLNTLQLGFGIGAGYRFGDGPVELGVRYTHGLTKIVKKDEVSYTVGGTSYSEGNDAYGTISTIDLSVALYFGSK